MIKNMIDICVDLMGLFSILFFTLCSLALVCIILGVIIYAVVQLFRESISSKTNETMPIKKL